MSTGENLFSPFETNVQVSQEHRLWIFDSLWTRSHQGDLNFNDPLTFILPEFSFVQCSCNDIPASISCFSIAAKSRLLNHCKLPISTLLNQSPEH